MEKIRAIIEKDYPEIWISKKAGRAVSGTAHKNPGVHPRVFQYRQGQNLHSRFAAHSHRQMLSPMPTAGKWPLRAV